MPTLEDTLTWRGQTMFGAGGEKIGSIEEIYLDAETNEPEWALVNTGLFGTKHSFVPLQEASGSGNGVQVPYDKSTIKDAPKMDPDGRLSQQEEQQLYQHYGLQYTEMRSDSGLPEGGAATGTAGTTGMTESTTTGTAGTSSAGYADTDVERGGPGRDTSGPNTDDAMTRSEEELTVGKTERETGRVRLKKYIVEDQVTQTVPVRREEVRIEREPITDANIGDATSGPDLSEEEHEVTLHAEEPVAQKRVVPKERVRLDKDVEVSEETVSDTLRKEQIDVEGDVQDVDRGRGL
jgi:uncharacterized protein (TIGR02271 family)